MSRCYRLMPLQLRPSGLGPGIDKEHPDYTVHCGGWDVGRIYQTRGGPDRLRNDALVSRGDVWKLRAMFFVYFN